MLTSLYVMRSGPLSHDDLCSFNVVRVVRWRAECGGRGGAEDKEGTNVGELEVVVGAS